MKLAKTLAVVVCVGLLSAAILGSTRYVYAQDADEIDQNSGAWGAPGADNAVASSPDVKVPPLNLSGCWSGTVQDTADGVGTATFQFHHHSNRKKLVIGSTFDFEWSDTAFALGPMKGKVSSMGFKFKGNAGKGCPVSGSATGDNTELTGTVELGGDCAQLFQAVTFSITPGCI